MWSDKEEEIKCKVGGCSNIKIIAFGLCSKHYQHERYLKLHPKIKQKTKVKKIRKKRYCIEDNCYGIHFAKGMCKIHYSRYYTVKRMIEDLKDDNNDM